MTSMTRISYSKSSDIYSQLWRCSTDLILGYPLEVPLRLRLKSLFYSLKVPLKLKLKSTCLILLSHCMHHAEREGSILGIGGLCKNL